MSYDINELLNIMNMYSKSSDDFWNSYKKNVDDSDNIISHIMDYVPIIKPKVNLKIALIGVGGVGKTTFLQRLSNNTFNRNYFPSIGYDLTYIVRDNITYEFYDFAGQEMYSGIYDNNGFYEMFNLIFLMIDKNSRVSHKHGISWLKRINKNKILLKSQS